MLERLAINDDGCVGVLRARVGSLVPHRAAEPTGLDGRLALLATCALRAIERGARPPHAPALRTGSSAVVALDALAGRGYRTGPGPSATERTVPPDRIHVVREAAPRILAIEAIDASSRRAIDEDPARIWALDADALAEWLHREPDVGLHVFAAADASEPGRYERVRVPTSPIRVHELPESAQRAIRDARFPVRFAEQRTLHVEDHFATHACDVVVATPPRQLVAPIDPVERRRLGVALATALALHALFALLFDLVR